LTFLSTLYIALTSDVSLTLKTERSEGQSGWLAEAGAREQRPELQSAETDTETADSNIIKRRMKVRTANPNASHHALTRRVKGA
jgi:hypothetical protein